MDVINKYGADALRFYMLSSPLLKAENLNFSEKDVDDALKKNIGRLGNVLAFYQLYADTSTSLSTGGTPRDFKSTNVLDQWIVARTAALIGEMTAGFESYRLDEATRPLAPFIDDLSVWYLRRSRDRFKEDGEDKKAALATLRYVLHTLSKLMAPSMPFFAEHVFQAVREGEDEESVHLAVWPEQPPVVFDAADVLTKMFTTRFLVSQALEARDSAKIKVRQPLSKLTIPAMMQVPEAFQALIRDEVNVKTVEFGDTLHLDTTISDELKEEGIVRDTIREIQAYRKEQNLKPGEPAAYEYSGDFRDVVEKHRTEIEKATSTRVAFSTS
jgi:isoleucyl-tRNA synthetase